MEIEDQLTKSRSMREKYENSYMSFQTEAARVSRILNHHEKTMPSWRMEMESTIRKVYLVLDKVENRMEEFTVWINHMKEYNRNEKIPADVINSLQEMIQDTSTASSMGELRVHMDEMAQEFCNERSRNDLMQTLVLNLQDKVEEFPRPSSTTSLANSRENLLSQDGNMQSSLSIDCETANMERDIIRKGIERLERQILQLIGSPISKHQVDIALLKRCKTVDVPAVNSAVGHIQKALQKYVGFKGCNLVIVRRLIN